MPTVDTGGAEPPRDAAWDGRSYGGSLGHRIFALVIRLAGRIPTYLLLVVVVPYYCLIARKAVRSSRAYRRRLDASVGLPPASWPRRVARTYRHFFEFGQVLVDRFIFHVRGDASFDFTGEGWEHIEAALAPGRGAIFLSAHVGAWEIASSIRRRFRHASLATPLHVVMHLPEGRAPSYVEVLEREGDLKVIPVRDAGLPFEVVNALGRGEIVAFHGDRTFPAAPAPCAGGALPDASRAGPDAGRRERRPLTVRVPFLGEPAAFPLGPWEIAAITGAPVVPTFLLKTGWRSYHFRVFPPVRVEAPRPERAAVVAGHVADYARLLEGLLREHPHEWFNFYDFWGQS